MPSVSVYYNNKAIIAIANNKTLSCKSRHIMLRLVVIKQLLKDGTLTKPLRRNFVNVPILGGMTLKPIWNFQWWEHDLC